MVFRVKSVVGCEIDDVFVRLFDYLSAFVSPATNWLIAPSTAVHNLNLLVVVYQFLIGRSSVDV